MHDDPEQFLVNFAARHGLPADPNAAAVELAKQRELQRSKVEMVAMAAALLDEDRPPEAVLLDRSYEPQPAWQTLLREVRGTGRRGGAYGVRRFDGMWHCQTYSFIERANEVR